MKLVALITLALLPVALGTPVIVDTDATGKPAPGDSAEFRVTASALLCRTEPNTYDGVALRQYPFGAVVTGTCWSPGEVINGNPYWIWTTDGCYSSYAYLQPISGGINQC